MSTRPSNPLFDDLDTLFCAVKARLRCIAEGSDEPTAAPPPEADVRIRANVLECVNALDQLHAMLAHEVERRQRLEQLVGDAQAALARAPPELVALLGLALRTPPICSAALLRRSTPRESR